MKHKSFFSKQVIFIVCTIISLFAIALWQILSNSPNYYLMSVAVLILSMLPFFISFEKENASSREITLIASLIALAVVSRAVFYLIPQIKPIAAVVAVSGVTLGAKRGYLVGAFSMFISNFIFGQGIWTPFQMVAMGVIGFLFGAVFHFAKPKKIYLAVAGFLTVFIFYGLIVDLSTVLMISGDINFSSVLAVYSTGIIFNLIFAVTTAIFLFLFGEAFIKKVNRINTKYGILKGEADYD